MRSNTQDALAATSREQALSRIKLGGPRALANHELLALLGIELDAEALAAAGGLSGLFDEPSDLLDGDGLPSDDVERIQAMLELHERWMAARLERGGPLNTLAQTKRYVTARFRGRRDEAFACIFLDAAQRIIAMEEIFRGTVGNASVHPRVVVRRSLVHNASGLIAVHNHPSGNATPSNAGRVITRRLVRALSSVDVRLFDHLVVGYGECVSFAERRILPRDF